MTKTLEQRAAEALRTFPLPSQSSLGMANYARILAWLYHGHSGTDVASLIIDLGSEKEP